MDINRLIDEIQKGKVDEYEVIVRSYKKKIFGFLVNKTKSNHLADELTQQTFIRAYEKLSTFNKEGSFGAWLVAIARNLMNEHYRKEDRTLRLVEKEVIHQEVTEAFSKSPEQIVSINERRDYILDKIEILPKKYRDVIYMKYFDDLSYEMMSERLEIPLGTVKSRLLRGKLLLKSSIERGECYEMY